MRVHTALHLLSVVVPLPVTGGAISSEKGRLDFDMPDAPDDKAVLQGKLNALIGRDLAVSDSWITDAELAANPGLVKTMSVMPPATSPSPFRSTRPRRSSGPICTFAISCIRMGVPELSTPTGMDLISSTP